MKRVIAQVRGSASPFRRFSSGCDILKTIEETKSTYHELPVCFTSVGDFDARMWVARDLFAQYRRNRGKTGIRVSRDALFIRLGRQYALEEGGAWDDATAGALFDLLCELLPETQLHPLNIETQLAQIQLEHDGPKLAAAGYQIKGDEIAPGVYRVIDKKLKRVLVAKKVRRLSSWGNVPKIKHANVVRIFAYINGFVIMEEVKGKQWNDEAIERLPRHLKLGVARQLFEGVAKLHACQTIHGDIKPGNVMIFIQYQKNRPVAVEVVLIDVTGRAVLNCIKAPEESRIIEDETEDERHARHAATDVYKAATMCASILQLPILKAAVVDAPGSRPLASVVAHAIEGEQGKTKRILKRSALVAVAFSLFLALWFNRFDPRLVGIFNDSKKVVHICGFDFERMIIDVGGVELGKGSLITLSNLSAFNPVRETGVIVSVAYRDNQPFVVANTKAGVRSFYFPRMIDAYSLPFFPDERQSSTYVYIGCQSILDFEPMPLVLWR